MMTTVQFVGGPWDGQIIRIPLGPFEVLGKGATIGTGGLALPDMPKTENTRYRYDGQGYAYHDPTADPPTD